MKRYCSTGQSPQRAVAPIEEEEEEEKFWNRKFFFDSYTPINY
jgi:hypothetical protein